MTVLAAAAALATAAVPPVDDARFDALMAAAAAGDTASLKLAARLFPGTDAGRAESIEGTLSAALQTNPVEVLRLLQAAPTSFTVARICEDRAIEPAPAEVAAFAARSTTALRAVTDRSLRTTRDACLASLRRTSGGAPAD